MPTMTPKEIAKALLEKNKISSPNSKKQNASVENSSTTNEEGNDVVTNSGGSNKEEQQGEDTTPADDRIQKIIPTSNKETGNTDTRAQELSPKHKQNKSSKHTKGTSRYPQRNGRVHSQKIPESQTNEKIDKPTRKDKDRDEKDSDKEMETMTQKLHTEPPKDRATKKKSIQQVKN
jgi:hypothetical protein